MNSYLEESNKLIGDIFKSAIKQCPQDNWESIEVIYKVVGEDVFDLEIKYHIETETISIIDKGEMLELLLDLIDLIEDNKKSAVKKAVFIIDNTGKFDVKYTY